MGHKRRDKKGWGITIRIICLISGQKGIGGYRPERWDKMSGTERPIPGSDKSEFFFNPVGKLVLFVVYIIAYSPKCAYPTILSLIKYLS